MIISPKDIRRQTQQLSRLDITLRMLPRSKTPRNSFYRVLGYLYTTLIDGTRAHVYQLIFGFRGCTRVRHCYPMNVEVAEVCLQTASAELAVKMR